MRKLSAWNRLHKLTNTTIVSVFLFVSVPVVVQDVLAQEQSPTVESTTSTPPVSPEVVEKKPAPQAVTAKDPKISIALLEVLLKPLPKENLEAEADAWFGILKAKAQNISNMEASIQRNDVQGDITGNVDTAKEKSIVNVTQLKTEQSDLANRLTTVLDALDAKGGDTKTYRQYVGAVSGIEFKPTDVQGLGLRFTTWLTSPEGGISLGFNLLKLVGILIVTVVIAPKIARLTDIALNRVPNLSNLFRGFVVMVVNRGVLVVGALIGLSVIGVNLGPILAVVGGASFVLAFALQSNLGNFASGLMLLINKPFDVGDEVKVAGYWAYVDSISLANTKLKDFKGNIVTLPNNTVWGGDIINFSHTDIRKIMLPIEVKFTQDISVIEKMWLEITAANSKVIQDPAPSIFPWNDSYNYYIWVGLSAWSKTDEYWSVYVELLKELQKSLKELNIELAAPVQAIKVESSSAETTKNLLNS